MWPYTGYGKAHRLPRLIWPEISACHMAAQLRSSGAMSDHLEGPPPPTPGAPEFVIGGIPPTTLSWWPAPNGAPDDAMDNPNREVQYYRADLYVPGQGRIRKEARMEWKKKRSTGNLFSFLLFLLLFSHPTYNTCCTSCCACCTFNCTANTPPIVLPRFLGHSLLTPFPPSLLPSFPPPTSFLLPLSIYLFPFFVLPWSTRIATH